MTYNSNLSPKVKELLNTIDWDYKNGTVHSEELLNQISSDKTLNLLVKAHKLDKIKHSHIAVDDLLKNAFIEAGELESNQVETTHLLVGILKTLGSKKYKKVKKHIKEILGLSKELAKEKKEKITENPFGEFPFEVNEKTANKDPLILEQLGVVRDLTKLAKQGKLKKVIPRESIEEKLISVISRKYKSSCMLVGPKGCGRTSLIISLAHRIAQNKVPQYLQDASIISINLPAMLNSFEMRDKFETGFKQFIEHKSKNNKFTIFFFDDLHLLSSAGVFGFSPPLSEQFLDLSSNSSRFGENDSKKVPNIAFISTMNNEYNDRFFDGPIHDMWEILEIPDPKKAEIKHILQEKKQELENYFNVNIPNAGFNYIINNLSALSLNNEVSKIDSAVNLLDDIFASFVSKYGDSISLKKSISLENGEIVLKSSKSIHNQNTSDVDKNLLASDVIDYYSLNTTLRPRYTQNIPLSFIKKHLAEEYGLNNSGNSKIDLTLLLNLYNQLSTEIIGQPDALNSLVSSIKRSSLGLTDPKKPIASILFLGPTGVGKTETAKALAKYVFGEKNIIRIDMSDFMEKHTVARLVGSPPGYVGYSEGGELTDFISQKPNSVVLFDEIEKAHPDVLNILLQILEEGQLTSGDKEVVSFNKAVVILTSNLGADLIKKEPIGFSNTGFDIENQNIKDRLLFNLKKEVKPEILNRLSDIVVFRMLNEKDGMQILRKEVALFQKKLLHGHKVRLTINPKVFSFLLKKGYSKEYGAREIKRSLEKNLVDKVVEFVISKPTAKNLVASIKKDFIVIDSR